MRSPFKSLYVQVLIGIAAGVILGFVAPERGAAMRPLGDGFIKLVKMLIAPDRFSTVVVGIAHMGAMQGGRADRHCARSSTSKSCRRLRS